MMWENWEYDIDTKVFKIAKIIIESTCKAGLGKKAGKELSIVNQCWIPSIMFTIK